MLLWKESNSWVSIFAMNYPVTSIYGFNCNIQLLASLNTKLQSSQHHL